MTLAQQPIERLEQASSPGAAHETRPLRVLLVAEPGIDGVFRHVEELTKFLLRQPGVNVHLAYSSVRGSPALRDLVHMVEERGGRTADLGTANAPNIDDIRAFWRLWRLTRELRPDVIHAHSSKAGALVRAMALIGVKARFFYTPHAYFEMFGRMSAKKLLFSSIERLLAHIGVTINVSSSEAAYARQKLGVPDERQRVIPNWVDCDRFRPVADAAEKAGLRRRFGVPPECHLLGTVARYSAQKDPITLYRALLPALATKPDFHFVHIGEGKLMERVAAMLAAAPPEVRSRVTQLSASDDLPGFYRMLDTFVLPSRYEGFSLAVLEALASGAAMILSDCPGNKDLKLFDVDGVHWVESGDVAQLTARLIADATSAPQPNNHRAIALSCFSQEKGCRNILRCYTSDR